MENFPWEAVISAVGIAATLGIAIIASLRGQTRDLGAQMQTEFAAMNQQSEGRFVRTHDRIERLERSVREEFITRREADANFARLSEGLAERDRQLEDLATRVECPNARKRL